MNLCFTDYSLVLFSRVGILTVEASLLHYSRIVTTCGCCNSLVDDLGMAGDI